MPTIGFTTAALTCPNSGVRASYRPDWRQMKKHIECAQSVFPVPLALQPLS